MKRVEGVELEAVQLHFVAAGKVAEQALCLRARCGSVIVKDGVVIGSGYNATPLSDETNRTCNEAGIFQKAKIRILSSGLDGVF